MICAVASIGDARPPAPHIFRKQRDIGRLKRDSDLLLHRDADIGPRQSCGIVHPSPTNATFRPRDFRHDRTCLGRMSAWICRFAGQVLSDGQRDGMPVPASS